MTERHLETTAAQLRASLAGGLLVEDHQTDFKRELGTTARASKDLAVDAASLAVDGGRLYIGVDEDGDPPSLNPIELAGLAERVDQIAASRVQPPLHVRCHQIPEPDAAAGHGYLVVVVLPSPDAPHQVDGKYRGRGDTTNRALTDPEVRDLLARRSRAGTDAAALLTAEIQRDPTTGILVQEHAHLFVVAQPVYGADDLLYRRIPDGDWASWLRNELLAGPMMRGLSSPGWEPDLKSTADQVARRAAGWALHSSWISQDRRLLHEGGGPVAERDLLDLEVREDGGLRLFCGRGSDTPGEARVLFMDLVAGLTWRLVRAALTVAETAQYYGSWNLGVALTNLRGVQAWSPRAINRYPTLYSEDEYRQTRQVTYEQLAGGRQGVLDQLVGRLARSLSASFTMAEVGSP